ncbi:hypothetical protein [Halospeciosus flavus]|uniref:Tat (Twin-arginine translocation) pathway signal sequence n=1 Tax=Halospeciosus flavus TaxID=3032283 RepID=A0ABD5Z6Y8_9EURY|nr:hypothetical protein [Halospeciosus flavus]
MPTDRRRFLAGAGTTLVAGLAGCASASALPFLGSEKEWKLRAMRADPDSTDHVCELDAGFVDAHPNLATVLDRADRTPRGEWCDGMLLTVETGNQLGRDLSTHCGDEFRGLYVYEGTHYFVSLLDRFPQNEQGHANGDGHHDGNDSHDGHDHSH